MSTLTKEDLAERAQLVRIHEANCSIEHPTESELAFRLAVMKKIAEFYDLRCLKDRSIDTTGLPKQTKK